MDKVFLALVRIGIGKETAPCSTFQVPIDWQEVNGLAEKQGLSAVVLDGIERQKSLSVQGVQEPSKVFLLQWIGEAIQGYEFCYETYRKSIAELAGFYNNHGYKMMVLKGYACSIDWPKPEHRLCGDIDIWLFGKQKEADKALAKEKGVRIDTSHHHHTVFNWHGFTVENHYDFINVYHHKSHVKLEKVFKELGMDDSYSVDVCGENVYLPSPNLHALFLLKHTMLHFVSGEINLRQILDWGFFVEKHGKEVDWKWLLEVLDEYGMMPAFNIFNAICVEDLGFEASIFPQVKWDSDLKDRALNEILCTESVNNVPKGFFANVFYRYRRWKASAWKHELCYKERMASAFWYGVWGHIIKPKTIRIRI